MTFQNSARFGLFFLLAFHGMSLIARAVAPVAPTNCVATIVGGARIHLTWDDNSTDETQWIIQVSANSGAFANYSATSANTLATGPSEIAANWDWNTEYRFRIVASNGTESSTASNEATVTTEDFVLTAVSVPGQTVVNLSWANIPNEAGYHVFLVEAGKTKPSFLGAVGANITTYQITAPTVESGKTYEFAVLPHNGYDYLSDYNLVTVTVDGVTSKPGASGTPGSSFSHTFTQVSGSGSAVVSRSLTGIPSGLSFNNSTGILSGFCPALGNHTLNYSVTFGNGATLTQTFFIRVRPPAGAPIVGTAIPAWNGAVGTSRNTDLSGTFTDPEAESAVRVSTTLGDIDFILFDTATPATVANFMSYVGAGKYTDVAFHRSIGGFVIQGGGFKGNGTGSDFTGVVTNPPVVNEPGIANVRGTVSMAKLGGDPNSATSQFFVSLGDNRSILDNQNGGFTVFGRVAGNGMVVAETINNLPTKTYNLYLNGSASASAFGNFPMNAATAPSVMDQSKLVQMNSVTSIPTISYSISGNTDPSVASASVVAGQLHLVGLAGGHTTITVTATDLDNLTNHQIVEVDIGDTFVNWASGITFPNGQSGMLQDPDGDALTNLEEYAFFGDPAVSSRDPLPVVGEVGVSPDPRFLALTFPLRKFTTGLSYVVEGSDSPTGAWTAVWSDSDGFESAQVSAAVDQADRTVVTIKDNVAIGGQPKRFLRTRIVQD